MALEHADGIEVACNLLDQSVTGPADVLELVEALAKQGGARAASSYRIGRSADDLLAMWERPGL